MPFESDDFDGVVIPDRDTDLDAAARELAPGMVEAIASSIGNEFEVTDVVVRTVLRAGDEHATIRWAVECVDNNGSNLRRVTGRELTVFGLSMVGPGPDRPVVTHYIDWAGVMGQLGMTTGRPVVDEGATGS